VAGANLQYACGVFVPAADGEQEAYTLLALQVLTVCGGLITSITGCGFADPQL
jgi:hypothetical protein